MGIAQWRLLSSVLAVTATLAATTALSGCTADYFRDNTTIQVPTPTQSDTIQVTDAEYAEVAARYAQARRDATTVLVQTYYYEVTNDVEIDTTRLELLKSIPIEDTVKEMRAMTGQLNWEILNLRYLIGVE